ncbi:MAG: bacterioferritin [Chloroflexi bacterium]|jgi:bacterioferritin|nr:bacterioferritin [Chloroflexota bacterium]
MKGNEKVIETLNMMLADELTAINQYIVHGEMAADWGYAALHEVAEKRAIDEMKHAESLIERILFLEGKPIVTELKAIHIGEDVEKAIKNDTKSEAEAIAAYNKAINVAGEYNDYGTRELFEKILKDEEAHIDVLEAQSSQIEQMGIQVFLAEQLED